MKRAAWVGGFVLLLALGLGVGLWLGSRRAPQPAARPTEEEWLRRLRSDVVEEGTKAWQQLAEMGDEGVPILLAARKDADVRVYRRAALGLVKVSAPAVPGLIGSLPRAGDRAELILVRIGKPAIPALEKALQDPERARSAARALGGMGARPDSVPALTELLLDRSADPEARAEAATALGMIGRVGEVVSALSAALSGPPKVQVAAARALRRPESQAETR
jgi:HEAT repeat protein